MKSSIANGESRGSINNILLKALQNGDKYGYEINKEIEIKSKGKFFLKEASLYSGLKRLQANGYITSYWQDGELGIRRHYYSITEKGLEKLNSSNFTWDDSKDFISEMFKDTPLTKLKQENNTNVNAVENSNDKIEENKEVDVQIAKEPKLEVKKNPFQIEVSPFQQSIFDLNLSNQENTEEKTENKECKEIQKADLNESDKNVASNLPILDAKPEEKTEVKEIEKIKTPTLEENLEKQYAQVCYQDIINNYNHNSYSQSLSESKEKIDISKYLTKDKENADNIIINKKEENLSINTAKPVEYVFDEVENFKTEQKNEMQSLENNTLNDTEVKNEEKTTTLLTEEFNKNENSVDIKNIFGSLLVDENIEEVNFEKNKELQEEIEEIEKPIIKQELPRINVDNDINITLNSSRIKNPTPPNFTHHEEFNIPSSGSSVPSVKQYINNVHKKTLISRATTVEEEVNLEGINIREYRKMNNKAIKNSNYIYKNKLNLFLTIFFSGLLILESIISFIFINKANCLGVFEILLLSTCILFGLTYTYYKAYIYFKDKYKVELKNFNFKNAIFYSCLIFVVIMIIFVCVNIFQGMNTNNINDFILKLFFEFLISFNIVLIPFVKLWFYNLKYFSN